MLLRPGDLTLRNTPLVSALFTISEIWKVNVVVGQQVQGQVNGVFRNAPLYEILDSILLSNGYGYRPVGHSLVVIPLKELGDLNPMFQSATITLRNTDPAEILEAARLLSSPQGKVQAVPSARSLMVLDFPDRVARVRQFVDELDRAGSRAAAGQAADESGSLRVAHFSPQFVAASSLQAAVETILSKDGEGGMQGKVAVMEPDNKLVVAAYPSQIELARQLIEQLDVPRQQVRITAMIYDLAVKDIERLGINWNHALKDRNDADGNPQSIWNIDSFLSVPVNAGLANGTMTFMNLSRHFDITAIVQALQEAQDSRLLANPNVTVLDHEKALMSIITEIPYQELTETQQGGNIGTTNFREAGVKLEVTPHIAADGTIRMEVSPSFSRLTGFTPGQNPSPIIDRREAKTVVRVTDRQVLVIGGLRQRNDTGNFNGLPYLKDIKSLNIGALFRGRDTEVRESELVVFIMPEIIPTTHVGSCREGVALQHGQCLLDQVPMATGGRPPYRPVPRFPPWPLDGPRVLGTPFQPNTCPPPGIVPDSVIDPPGAPGAELLPVPDAKFLPVPVPDERTLYNQGSRDRTMWELGTGTGRSNVVRLPPIDLTEPVTPAGPHFRPNYPATHREAYWRPPAPVPGPRITAPRITGVRAIVPQ
ncbi:MAG: hypothetical protein HQ567_05545 [Candidatus Nealsonbacteria bacterium]|nr:hypothetical protein [Candidatus Nealsonbacteria bacterium]